MPIGIPFEAGSDMADDNTLSAADKVRMFPTTPGVYLMKDAQGRVIYVGKAKNLRARAGSYFQKTAADDPRIADWIGEVVDVDFLPAESEVDALLMEARLIKDIQPKHNQDLKDDKSSLRSWLCFGWMSLISRASIRRASTSLSAGRKSTSTTSPIQSAIRGSSAAVFWKYEPARARRF